MKITELAMDEPNSCLPGDLQEAVDKVMKLFVDEKVRQTLRDKIAGLNCSVFEKSDAKAAQHRINGNLLFKQESFEEANSEYSKAVNLATFPSIENPESGKELAKAFANRSAALLHLERYSEGLEDIELAIKYHYEDHKKLIVRRNQCLKLAPEDFIEERRRNSTLPFVRSIKINDSTVITENKRRGCVATQNISKGDIALNELPYASCISSGLYYTNCYECFASLPKRIFPCRTCTLAKYCSEECSEISWARGHMFECGFIELWDRLFAKKVDVPFSIAYRVLVRDGIKNSLNAARSKDLDTIQVNMMREKNIPVDEDDSQKSTLATAYVLAFLAEYSKMSTLRIACKEDWPLIGGLLLKYYQNLVTSATSVKERKIKYLTLKENDDLHVLEDKEVGFGFYEHLSAINHSCKPNLIVSYFQDNMVVVRAMRDIKQGEEVTVSYGPTYKSDTYLERRSLLKQMYNFDCDCSACRDKEESNSQALLCSKCKGPVSPPLEEEDVRCTNCSDGLIEKELIEQTQINLRISKMGCLKLVSKDVDIRKAEHPLLEAHRFLGDVLHPTHHEMGIIKERLAYTYKIMRKYKLMLRYANEFMKCTEEEYDVQELGYFNGLVRVIDRQRDFAEYVLNQDKVEDVEYKEDYKAVREDLTKNLDLALELVESHVHGERLFSYKERLESLLRKFAIEDFRRNFVQ